MTKNILTRRALFETGAVAFVASLTVPAIATVQKTKGLDARNEEAIRKYYKSWETRDWHPFDVLLADNFTFTSAAGDDHISKAQFKTRCWDTQVDFVGHFDLKHVFGNGNDALVLYVCTTKNGKTFKNAEYHHLKEGSIEAIECYFGAASNYTSAVAGKS
ncbi:MAG: nuclear transport factor 2 family protein [Steroidobacter sp.]